MRTVLVCLFQFIQVERELLLRAGNSAERNKVAVLRNKVLLGKATTRHGHRFNVSHVCSYFLGCQIIMAHLMASHCPFNSNEFRPGISRAARGTGRRSGHGPARSGTVRSRSQSTAAEIDRRREPLALEELSSKTTGLQR